eukprot:3325357-Prymnesium_polylepis.1
MLFCKTAADISGIVGHTCGVERAGKAYKQVLGPLRKSMDETRASKAIFVFSNYNLRNHKQSAGDAFSAFNSDVPAAPQMEAVADKEPYAKYILRRGNLIFNDVTEEGGSDGEEGEEGGGEEGGDGEEGEGEEGGGGEGEEDSQRARVVEVKWAVPTGFEVAPEPDKLDMSLV